MTFDVEAITSEHALSVLKKLTNEDKKIAKRIQQIITHLISSVEPEEVAGEIASELDSIEVEDLWDSSGSTRGGYVDTYEMAYEMVEDALSPFLDRLNEYKALSMEKEAKLFCMGIIRGLYLFNTESDTQFRKWAEDVAGNVFEGLLITWEKEFNDKKYLTDIKQYIEESCQEWFSTTLFK
jgi:uncharacterized membrane-anchored protein YjiN (DUF445 family)